jgi:protein O-GlcNAc transferase
MNRNEKSTNEQDINGRLDEAAKNFHAGNLAEAEKICRLLLAANHRDPRALCLLGSITYSAGRSDEAIALIEQAISSNPNFVDAHANLGAILKANGQNEKALESIECALGLNPNLTAAINNKGVILETMGHLDEAVMCYQKCLDIKPENAEALNNLGNVHMKRDELGYAVDKYKEALNINPNYSIALENMGFALQRTGQLVEAAESLVKAVAANPKNAESHNKLGAILLDMGELDEAIKSFQRAIILDSNNYTAAYNYLHVLLYSPSIDNNELFDEYCRVVSPNCSEKKSKSAEIFVDPKTSEPYRGHTMPASMEQLRIGYVSSDFKNHPVGNNFLPLITNHDQEAFDVFCYADLNQSDEVTKKIQSHSRHWREINGLSDEQVAQKVQKDKINILVFLGGYFDKNRPNIAIHRAAPIQVSMYGGTTTALDAMDYWMTDAILHPPDADPSTAEKFTETLCRLPNLYTYPHPENTPSVSTLPADKNDFITFASFNKPCKMNDEVLDLWSQVLIAVPGSQLIVKSKDYFASPFIQLKLESRFEKNGIDPIRINMLSSIDDIYDHLANYHKADIALDTFPFAGATTTFQALWMGLPVISLMGNRFISRMGGAISLQVGLEGTIAKNKDEFVTKVVALANDRPKLRKIRKTLRHQISTSVLCNGPTYARNFENAFRSMSTALLRNK